VYEYLVERLDKETLEEMLDCYGRQGWRLIQLVPARPFDPRLLAVFIRSLKDAETRELERYYGAGIDAALADRARHS